VFKVIVTVHKKYLLLLLLLPLLLPLLLYFLHRLRNLKSIMQWVYVEGWGGACVWVGGWAANTSTLPRLLP
jgi:hypothetical protein